MIIINNNTQKSGGFTPEEVIKALQGYPYNVTIYTDVEEPIKNYIFEGDLLVTYDISQATDMRLFAEGSFLANHVKKVNIMGNDIEDIASLPSILTMTRDTYYGDDFSVQFTLDTDTIEGDLFGINYNNYVPFPRRIYVNCKVKSLDCSKNNTSPNIAVLSMLNSPTEILEQGSIKGTFGHLILPLALKNLEENAFVKYSTTEGGEETDCEVQNLYMLSLTVPESLSQSLSISERICVPTLIGERTYKDYVKDVFNFDVTTREGANKVLCINVSTGEQLMFRPQS